MMFGENISFYLSTFQLKPIKKFNEFRRSCSHSTFIEFQNTSGSNLEQCWMPYCGMWFKPKIVFGKSFWFRKNTYFAWQITIMSLGFRVILKPTNIWRNYEDNE